MPEPQEARGLLDTSVVVDLDLIAESALPAEYAVSALTLAELSAGPHAASTGTERAHRLRRLQFVESSVASLPFDDEAARAYGQIYAVVVSAGRKARGARAVDLMIAATALAHGLPLFTRNPRDFSTLAGLVSVRSV